MKAVNSSETTVEDILQEDIESDNVAKKDHMLLLTIGFPPFLLSIIWYLVYSF